MREEDLKGLLRDFSDEKELAPLLALSDFLEDEQDPKWHPTIQVLRHCGSRVFRVGVHTDRTHFVTGNTVRTERHMHLSLPEIMQELGGDTHWNCCHHPMTPEVEGVVGVESDWGQTPGYEWRQSLSLMVRHGLIPKELRIARIKGGRKESPRDDPPQPADSPFLACTPALIPLILYLALDVETGWI